MKLDVTTLDGKAAGSIELADAIFGIEPRADILQRVVRWQLAKRRAGTHKTSRAAPRSAHRQEDVQAEGHRRRPSRRAARRSSAAAAAPTVRSCAATRIDLPKKVRALALQAMRCRPRPRTAASIVLDKRRVEGRQDQALRGTLRQARPRPTRWSSPAPRSTANFAPRRAQHPEHRRAAGAGLNVYDILRRHKLVLTKAAVDALEARFK